MTAPLSAAQWRDYDDQGFVHLGPLLGESEVVALRGRADDLAAGRVTNPAVQLQRDTGGRYEDLSEVVADLGGETLLYRKVQGLEQDDLFRQVLNRPVFAHITARHYGPHAAVSLFRAMVMNKPAGQGTVLPWHQDGGNVWKLDRDPLVTIWIALDDATAANGCVELVPGTHRLGLLTDEGSNVRPEDAAVHCPEERVHQLEVPAGHGVLIHNWTIHRSGVNPTQDPRRAFTACYMDARSRSTLTGAHFPVVFGSPDHAPEPYLGLLTGERDAYRASQAAAEEYALSLRAENERLEASLAEATAYARSLEAARDR